MEYALMEAGISGDMKKNMKMVNELETVINALKESLDSKPNAAIS